MEDRETVASSSGLMEITSKNGQFLDSLLNWNPADLGMIWLSAVCKRARILCEKARSVDSTPISQIPRVMAPGRGGTHTVFGGNIFWVDLPLVGPALFPLNPIILLSVSRF